VTTNRVLAWDGCCNIRDLGGLPTEDGGRTRFRSVVRADNITLLSADGWRALRAYGVQRIVDLRNGDELAEDPAHLPDVDVVHTPTVSENAVFAQVDSLLAGVTDAATWRRRNYLHLLEHFRENFGRAVSAVASAPDGVVVIHCAGGVDRTGIVSALILRSAGVGTDEVALDWAQSEVGWAPFVGEWIATAENEEEAAKRRRLATMPVEVMRDVLAELEDRHGGIDGYLGAAGVTDSNLRLLHARLRG
jgi:protein tyrosine/serine phosphatase